MKTVVIGLAAVTLAALTAGCGYSERTYAVQAPAPSIERAVAVVNRTAAIEKRFNGLSGPSQTVSP
jgi:hypothetical protein